MNGSLGKDKHKCFSSLENLYLPSYAWNVFKFAEFLFLRRIYWEPLSHWISRLHPDCTNTQLSHLVMSFSSCKRTGEGFWLHWNKARTYASTVLGLVTTDWESSAALGGGVCWGSGGAGVVSPVWLAACLSPGRVSSFQSFHGAFSFRLVSSTDPQLGVKIFFL